MTIDSIAVATRRYEAWLANQIPILRSDLALKHRRMRRDPFSFLRATCYRWAQLWPIVCDDVKSAPTVLAVGDLHVENFGTWRDQEGRLIWGINDFDESYRLPYTADLVRLAVSAALAIETGHLTMKVKHVCDAVLMGYQEGLQSRGCPFVLEEGHRRLYDMVMNEFRDPLLFWRKMDLLPKLAGPIPPHAKAALFSLLPSPRRLCDLRRRTSGLGSLGHPRFVALTYWQGAKIARETKALRQSVWAWAQGHGGRPEILYGRLLDSAVRCPDPLVQVQGNWLVRRLSPFCSRIELPALSKNRDERHLLYAMGRETANVHLGSRGAIRAVTRDLARRKSKWLRMVTKRMAGVVMSDWKTWKG